MPLSKSIYSYADIPIILDPIVKAGGGTYRLPTPRMATAWRQRAYHYRNLLRAQLAGQNKLKNFLPQTPYDLVTLLQDGDTITVQVGVQIMGEVTLNSGETYTPTAPTPAQGTFAPDTATDELTDLALDLINLHEGEE